MKTWTPQDIEYLESSWSEVSIPTIAKNLKRTVNAIKLKAFKIGLRRHLHSGDEITLPQLFKALGREGNYSYCRVSWPKHGCPVKKKTSIKKKYLVIKIEDFWKWAEKNKHLVDFSQFQENMLGAEPSWVAAKRRADIAALKYKTTPWTATDDRNLIYLLKQFKYGYRDISEKLCRTEGSIKKRMVGLGLKQRPVRMPNHNPWEPENIEKVQKMQLQGCIPELIAGHVGRSASAVRGLIERLGKEGKLLLPEKVRKEHSKGVHYKTALPEEQWGGAKKFFTMMAVIDANTAGRTVDLDLKELRDAFGRI